MSDLRAISGAIESIDAASTGTTTNANLAQIAKQIEDSVRNMLTEMTDTLRVERDRLLKSGEFRDSDLTGMGTLLQRWEDAQQKFQPRVGAENPVLTGAVRGNEQTAKR